MMKYFIIIIMVLLSILVCNMNHKDPIYKEEFEVILLEKKIRNKRRKRNE